VVGKLVIRPGALKGVIIGDGLARTELLGKRRMLRVNRKEINARMTPVRKKPNMIFEANLRRERIVVISAGRGIVAPAKSSERMMVMGLNQKSALGVEQNVMPSSLYPSQ
jgi:hypothetical protein